MTIFQNADRRWVYHDGSTYRYFNSQQEAEKMAQYSTIGETSAEVEIAAIITIELLPQLRNALLQLSSLQMAWHANDIDALVAAAAESNGTVAGLPVEAWQAWAAVFPALQTWLNTPLDGGKITPAAILLRRYTRKELNA